MATSETIVRDAFEALARGDVGTMLSAVDQNLEWTYLDTSEEDPSPSVCHGRNQLGRWSGRARGMTLEEVVPYSDRVLVVTRTPGLEARRAWASGDRSFHVVTVRNGLVVALRACRSRQEAEAIAAAGSETG